MWGCLNRVWVRQQKGGLVCVRVCMFGEGGAAAAPTPHRAQPWTSWVEWGGVTLPWGCAAQQGPERGAGQDRPHVVGRSVARGACRDVRDRPVRPKRAPEAWERGWKCARSKGGMRGAGVRGLAHTCYASPFPTTPHTHLPHAHITTHRTRPTPCSRRVLGVGVPRLRGSDHQLIPSTFSSALALLLAAACNQLISFKAQPPPVRHLNPPHTTGILCKIVTVVINLLIWDKHATPAGIGFLLVW